MVKIVKLMLCVLTCLKMKIISKKRKRKEKKNQNETSLPINLILMSRFHAYRIWWFPMPVRSKSFLTAAKGSWKWPQWPTPPPSPWPPLQPHALRPCSGVRFHLHGPSHTMPLLCSALHSSWPESPHLFKHPVELSLLLKILRWPEWFLWALQRTGVVSPACNLTSWLSSPFTLPPVTPPQPPGFQTHWACSHIRALTIGWFAYLGCSSLRFPPGSLPYLL